jgi:transcriptional regulator with XRE-family HTH domain
MLGAELRALRETRGLSLRQVTDSTGIAHSSLVAIESGRRYPTLRTLEALAECLNMNVTIGPHETVIEPLD